MTADARNSIYDQVHNPSEEEKLDDDQEVFLNDGEDEPNKEQAEWFFDDEQGQETDWVEMSSERIHPFTIVSIQWVTYISILGFHQIDVA